MFGWQILLGSLIVVSTVVFHVAGLVYLAGLLKRIAPSNEAANNKINLMSLLAMAVLVIILIHTLEAWMWAVTYYLIGEFSSMESAVYFSVVTATTLGYGDITLSARWRLLSAFEAMGGLLLFGASTAFLLGLMRNLFEDTSS